MIKTLLNPFQYIAGFKSLGFGLLILLATACAGYFSHTHFPDIISVKIGASFPILYFIVQSLVNWLVLSLILYIIALMASPSTIRIIDIFGTQAFARFPYFLAGLTGFSGSMHRFAQHIMWQTTKQGEPVNITIWDIAFAIIIIVITVLLTIWMIALMYNAFKVSANLKGPKSGLLFTIGLILAMLATIFLNQLLVNQII